MLQPPASTLCIFEGCLPRPNRIVNCLETLVLLLHHFRLLFQDCLQIAFVIEKLLHVLLELRHDLFMLVIALGVRFVFFLQLCNAVSINSNCFLRLVEVILGFIEFLDHLLHLCLGTLPSALFLFKLVNDFLVALFRLQNPRVGFLPESI